MALGGQRVALRFLVAALVTLGAGLVLEQSGERLAAGWGLSGVVFGATLLAASTSVPEISTGIASAQVANAPHGMVVSQEQRATRIGLDVLERGGNAVDAAVAVGFALAVSLPKAGNIGGGGFMVVHLAGRNATVAIDYRETAPTATRSDVFLGPEGQADPRKSRDPGSASASPAPSPGWHWRSTFVAATSTSRA